MVHGTICKHAYRCLPIDARGYHFMIPKWFHDCLEYILATEVYIMCMHFLEEKKRLREVGLEIFNSRQNRIQSESSI